MLASLAAGAVLYLVSVKISLALTGYQLADTGNGLAQLTRLGPAAILAGIPATYLHFFKTLLGYSGWNDRGMRAASAVLLLLTLWGLFLRLRGKTRRAVVQSLIAVALLPLGLNVVYLLASGNVYILMQHACSLSMHCRCCCFPAWNCPGHPGLSGGGARRCSVPSCWCGW